MMLNSIKNVLRYKADPEAFAAFAKDTDPTGNIAQPILTMRAIDDPIAFVELADTWEQTVAKAGHSKTWYNFIPMTMNIVI